MIPIEDLTKHVDFVLKETNLKNMGEKKVGKVRDIYIQKDKIILVSTDRHTSFDRIIAHVPCKGAVLTGTSHWWFEQTKDIVPNHIIDMPDPNVVVVKKCEVIKVEAVVRGYMTGSTNTSIWMRYQAGERSFGGHTYPDGIKKNEKLPEPIFDPTTKEDEHDRALTLDELIAEGFATKEVLMQLKEKALALFKRGQEVAAKHGLILVDTKYEFGLDENGTLTLIDEIHTPDSSRYWKLASYDERMKEGKDPENFDKEFLRLWFKDNCDPYNDAVLPEAPKDMVAELSRRYIEIYEIMTKKEFTMDFSTPIEERIATNLKNYYVA
ncbi:MAG: phosphoribosylaminoimidazolesuccinocarboxamide synthase [Candidatus Pacebacteria bacterium]|nr:phosphoribosylaminoimidazolesuccinocarboxamide synthase [Candidatus Paceibacterota bacterium]